MSTGSDYFADELHWLTASLLGDPKQKSALSREDIWEALDKEIRSLHVLSVQDRPPFDMSEIARLRKVRIEQAPISRDGLLVPVHNGFVLRVRQVPTTKRGRAVVAHELGHTFFYDLECSPPKRRFIKRETGTSRDREEWIAYRIGRELLVPLDYLRRALDDLGPPSIETLQCLSEAFQTSYEILLRRLVHDSDLWDCLVFIARESPAGFCIARNDVFRGGRFKDISVKGTLEEDSGLRRLVDKAAKHPNRVVRALISYKGAGAWAKSMVTWARRYQPEVVVCLVA